MKLSNLPVLVCSVFVALALAAATPAARAQIIWNGPTITFTHAATNGLADQITPGVAITRGSSGGLYNSVTETNATAGFSPQDSLWAIGSLANYTNLVYAPCILEMGHSPANFIGTNFVVYLTNEDIYFALTLTGWGLGGKGGDTSFSYTRTTAPIVLSGANLGDGQVSFSYNTITGLSYVVLNSTDLVNWAAAETNVASTNTGSFSMPVSAGGNGFYRVEALPNP